MQCYYIFSGVVKVNIEETPDGCVALTAYPDELQSSGELSHYYDDHLLSDSSEEEQVNCPLFEHICINIA